MAVKKRRLREEPFLNTVARKLGSAAGTLTKASKDLAGSLSALPEKVTAKVEEIAHAEMPAKRRRGSTVQRKNRARSSGLRGTSRTAAKKKKTMRSATRVPGRRSSVSKK